MCLIIIVSHYNSTQIPVTMSVDARETTCTSDSMSTPADVHASCGDRVHLPPVPTSSSLTGSVNKTNDRIFPVSTEMESRDRIKPPSNESVKLPALVGNGSLVALIQHNTDRGEAAVELRSSPSHEAITKPRHLARNEASTSLASHDATMKLNSSLSHESALKLGKGKNPKTVQNSSSNDQLSSQKYPLADNTTMNKSASPVKLKSQMKLTRYSAFKDTLLGYKPAAVHNQRDNSADGAHSHNTDQDIRDTTIKFSDSTLDTSREHTATQTRKSSSTEQLNIVNDAQGSLVSHSPHSPSLDGLDEHLYQQAQRYDKLNQVLTLLQQAKNGKTQNSEGSEPGTPVKISELKTHIKTALDEAVRLRADTEALQQRVITTVSLPCACTCSIHV